MPPDIVQRIQQFNQGRLESLLELKYKAMRNDMFTFFRGTCHIFYEDWPSDSPLNSAPLTWICGDLHIENFGSFKGDNRLVYFDLNDFDEAVLAPCTWEIARFLTSILLAAQTLKIPQTEAEALSESALNAYVEALSIGHVYTVEPETADGLIKDLLTSLKERKREDFLNGRTNLKNGQRQLKIDNKRTNSVTKSEYDKVTRLIESIAVKRSHPDFFKVLDVAHRIAGTGSLGLERYVILVEGKGSPNKNYFLDLKVEPNSSLAPYLQVPQPQWSSQAKRCLTIKKRMQATPPAYLFHVEDGKTSYLLRELQPLEDRVNLKQCDKKSLERLLQTMGSLTAWAQLRSAGRQGSDIPDRLMDWAHQPEWQKEILAYAQTYFKQVQKDYEAFCQAKI